MLSHQKKFDIAMLYHHWKVVCPESDEKKSLVRGTSWYWRNFVVFCGSVAVDSATALHTLTQGEGGCLVLLLSGFVRGLSLVEVKDVWNYGIFYESGIAYFAPTLHTLTQGEGGCTVLLLSGLLEVLVWKKLRIVGVVHDLEPCCFEKS